MDPEIVKILICPHCGDPVRELGGSLVCSNNHTANIARQGYASLLGRDSGTHTADSAEMIAARERFLSGAGFDPLIDAVASAVAAPGIEEVDGVIVDLGAGSGRYLAVSLDSAPERYGLGVDNSKFAARRSAKCHQRAEAIVADIWDGIPVRSGAAAVLINVFAPRNAEEMERLLAGGGRLVVVTPNQKHLCELIEAFGMIGVDPAKSERLDSSLGNLSQTLVGRDLSWEMELGPEGIRDLVEMGPSAGRLDPADLQQRIEQLDEKTAVTASVRIHVSES